MSCVIQTHLTCITPAEELPIDVGYARKHLRGLGVSEDELIEDWIRSAAQYFEHQTERPILHSVWEYWLDAAPLESFIEIPRPPLVSVESVQYATDGGTLVDWEDGSPLTPLWEVMAPQGPYAGRGWIMPLSSGLWPSIVTPRLGSVRIRFTAGMAATPADVPANVRSTLLLLVGSFDQFRSEQHFSEGARVEMVPFGAEQVMDGYKKTAVPTQRLHRL